MLSDGHLDGRNLICGVRNWGYRVDTGISAYANDEKLPKFNAWIEGGDVLVDTDEIKQWKQENPTTPTSSRTRSSNYPTTRTI
jgi:hypothetical protein|tara:strand:+ start:151 stop:399 length:249 start_codon:yes stop_codon:yes gene_type:complete